MKIHTAVLTSGDRRGHLMFVNDRSERELLLDIYEANKLEIDPPDYDHVGPPPEENSEWWVKTIEGVLNVEISLDEHDVRTPPVVVAHVDTRNYEFEGAGADEHEAALALQVAWKRHCDQNQYADFSLWAELANDITYRTYTPGTPYRDGEEISHG